jgi:hypothetical protein
MLSSTDSAQPIRTYILASDRLFSATNKSFCFARANGPIKGHFDGVPFIITADIITNTVVGEEPLVTNPWLSISENYLCSYLTYPTRLRPRNERNELPSQNSRSFHISS